MNSQAPRLSSSLTLRPLLLPAAVDTVAPPDHRRSSSAIPQPPAQHHRSHLRLVANLFPPPLLAAAQPYRRPARSLLLIWRRILCGRLLNSLKWPISLFTQVSKDQ
ncbi:uncharacterized protein [Spinacia oleracea]|uniref:Uncharacterized protein n=1 Tax=Spinacia oleracea TaxID=3562 RepID=A0ABM3QLD4_SPIOL|nr:uncharacterized protein LOC110796419 [Spinacia oleracea]